MGNYYQSAGANNLCTLGSEALYEFGGNMLTAGQVAGQIASHAIVGGVSSSLSGGKFGHGFFSAGVTKGVGGAFLPGGSDLSAGQVAYGTVISAVIGGTASAITGGKFANGANTAAMQYLFNQSSKSWNKAKVKINKNQARKVLSIFGDGVPDEIGIRQHKYAQYLLDQMVDASYGMAVIDKTMNYLFIV